MLGLTRKPGESIILKVIGESGEVTEVNIKVTSVDGLSVRLGVDAPNNVKIYREELIQDGLK